MWDLIHTEQPNGLGYGLTILFYAGCLTALALVVIYIVLPVVRSVTGKTAAMMLSPMVG